MCWKALPIQVVDLSILRRAGIESHDAYIPQSQNTIIIRSSLVPDSPRFDAQYKYDKPRSISGKPIVYKPAVQLDERNQFQPHSDVKAHLQYFLQNLFRELDFREGQLPILSRALQRKNVIGLLPTGGGKSLTYQLAALLQPGVTMVIDPIKLLMQDQYEGLLRIGIDAAGFINSSLSLDERTTNEARLRGGQMLFCFGSPERLVIKRFREEVLAAMAENNVYFPILLIDEVHCVSEWGHDFGTAYLSLGENCQKFCSTADDRPVPLFGLTATASFDVLADVGRELFINVGQESDALVRYENTHRPELQVQDCRYFGAG